MQKKDGFYFGTVFKLHGYKGDVNIFNDNGIVLDFNKLKYFLIEINNQLVPYFIENIRETKPNILLVKFEDLDSQESAIKLKKLKVYLNNKCIPDSNDNNHNDEKIIGYSVFDNKFGNLGEINYINTQTKQKLIYVKKEDKQHRRYISAYYYQNQR